MKGSAESPGGLEELLVLKFSRLATECLELDMSRKWIMARSTKPDITVSKMRYSTETME